jgi:hypothetical protein
VLVAAVVLVVAGGGLVGVVSVIGVVVGVKQGPSASP